MTLRGFVAGWAALGVVLSGATQLRPAELPLGPGELLLVTWMMFVTFLLLRGMPFSSGRVFRIMLFYWLASVALLGFGAMIALLTSRTYHSAALHDGLAFLFAATFSCLISLNLGNSDDGYYTQLARFTFFIMTFCCTLLLVMAMAAPGLGPISFWWGYRFSGWAKNPNQMALFMLGMPFLGGYLLQRSRRFWYRAVYVLAIGCCIWVGWATASDSLRVAWAVTLGGIGLLAWYRAVFRARGGAMYLSHLVVPIVAAALAFAFGDDLVMQVRQTSQAMYEEGDQGSIRVTLWLNGIEAITHSPLVGFGPGSYSGLNGPFEGDEAHNTFIDWGMSTGVVGVLLHLGLLVLIGWRALRSNSFASLGLVASLVVFAMFAYTLRQPIYWLLLVLALAFAERRSRAGAEARASTPATRFTPRARGPLAAEGFAGRRA